MEQEAKVISVNSDMTAEIEANRTSACEGCHQNADGKGCVVCTLTGNAGTVRAKAYNRVGAKAGDMVAVQTEPRIVLSYALVTFILPVVIGLAAYFVCAHFSSNAGYSTLAMLGGFALTFVALYFWSRRKKSEKDIVIVRIISYAAEETKQAEGETEIKDPDNDSSNSKG